MKPHDGNYGTSDLGLATGLVSSGFRMKYLVRDEKTSRVTFVFANTLELSDAVARYWKKELTIDAQTYFNAMKQLKNQLYSDAL